MHHPKAVPLGESLLIEHSHKSTVTEMVQWIPKLSVAAQKSSASCPTVGSTALDTHQNSTLDPAAEESIRPMALEMEVAGRR